MTTYLIIKGNKYLCRDNKWREVASFGDSKNCIKSYKKESYAIRKSNNINAIIAYKILSLVGKDKAKVFREEKSQVVTKIT